MKQDKKDLIKNILKVPTISDNLEYRLRDSLVDMVKDIDGIEYEIDKVGNLIITKHEDKLGEYEYFPCVVAYIDTVYISHEYLVHNNISLNIEEEEEYTEEGDTLNILYALHPLTGEQTGIGGDDKAGVGICMLLLMESEEPLKVMFFVSEEIGCKGSKAIDESYFEDVGYFIQFDAPGDDWVSESTSGVTLYTDEALEQIQDILDDYSMSNYSTDPFTDVMALKKRSDVVCFNFFAGYYRMHTSKEIVILDFLEKSFNMSSEIISRLGNNKFEFKYEPNTYKGNNMFGGGLFY